jgi:hypothetical protein
MKKRSGARGRLVPQSLSTDPRFGRLSLPAKVLFPLLWINSDDQGRFSGDPEEIKYAACPSVKEISADDIPQLLQEMQQQKLIFAYNSSKSAAIQMLDWWEEQNLQWAYPSLYAQPDGWADRLRYHVTPKEIISQNWPSPGRATYASPLLQPPLPLTTPSITDKEVEEGSRRGRGRGRLPNSLGSSSGSELGNTSAPSLAGPDLSDYLFEIFPQAFGHTPTSRETAQLQDLATEITDAGGAKQQQVFDAFKEACDHAKFSVSYVRAVLLDWLAAAKQDGKPPAKG